MRIAVFIILLIMASACVKDESNVGSAAGSTGTTSGGSSGGSSGNQTLPDPLASQAWHLKNTGTQHAFSLTTGSNGEDINVEPVHTLFNIRGRNIRIAVSDTGTDIDHSDLSSNALSGEHRNYTSSQSNSWHNANPYPSGDEFHGTGVTGLIAALGWNGIGSRGVAPSAKFASFRYLFDPLPGETDSSRLAKQLDQLYGDFDIFNYSYGKAGYIFVEEDQVVRDAVKLGITNLRNGKGALYVQSAGNSFYEKFAICDDETDPLCTDEASGNTNAHESLSTPYKIVVGATNALGKLASYSTPGSSIWVSAPGGEDGIMLPAMVTTDISGCVSGLSYRDTEYEDFFDFGFHNLNSSCDYTNRFNGTSSAAPVVSGVIALMLEANPQLTWRDVKHILAETSDVIDLRCPPYDLYCSFNELTHPLNKDVNNYLYDYIWTRNSAGNYYSNYYGFGRVNAEAAVSRALTYDLSTLSSYKEITYESGDIVGLNIPDNSNMGAENKIWVGHNYIVESVQIKFNSNHPWPGDVAVHLVSPSGTESRLMNINSNIYSLGFEPDALMISNAFYGEESEGYWTIKLYDGDDAMGSGSLLNWKIQINGHISPIQTMHPMPVTGMNFGPVPVSNSMTPLFTFIHSSSLLTLDHYEAAIGTTPFDENIHGWTDIGLNDNGQRLTGLTLTDDVTYFLKIRAFNGFGYSSVQILPWKADFQ